MDDKVNKALLKLNEDYLNVINSKEYNLGRRIIKYVDIFKCFRVKVLINRLKYERERKKAALYNDKCRISKYYDEGEKPVSGVRVVVYTCITRGYDGLKNPIYCNSAVDYICFSDSTIKNNVDWIVRDTADFSNDSTGNYINRYYKMHPFEMFSGKYEFAIYIDGNVQTVGDMSYLCNIAKKGKTGIAMHLHPLRSCVYKEAEACLAFHKGNKTKIEELMLRYKKEGFPEKYGLPEATIIVVDLQNKNAKTIMDAWWEEFCNNRTGRDQLAFPYVLWKLGYEVSDIGCLGNSKKNNPMFRFEEHSVI